MPEWAVTPVYVAILTLFAALVFCVVSIGVYYLSA